MFINISNHPSNCWTPEQMAEALVYGEILDIPFPVVSPTIEKSMVQNLALKTIDQLPKAAPLTVHIMGEMTLTYAIVSILKDRGIRCVASTTERIVTDNPDGSKTSIFKFVQFREY